MDSSVSPKDEIWFLRLRHYISTGLYCDYGDKEEEDEEKEVDEKKRLEIEEREGRIASMKIPNSSNGKRTGHHSLDQSATAFLRWR